MHSKLAGLLFSWHGRVARQKYFWTALLVSLLFLVLFVFLDTMIARAASWLIYPPYFWIMFCLAVKRLHDAGTSARWLLLVVIPVLGPLWLAWLLLFRKGSPGENQYGNDPLEAGDYLAVDIHAGGSEP